MRASACSREVISPQGPFCPHKPSPPNRCESFKVGDLSPSLPNSRFSQPESGSLSHALHTWVPGIPSLPARCPALPPSVPGCSPSLPQGLGIVASRPQRQGGDVPCLLQGQAGWWVGMGGGQGRQEEAGPITPLTAISPIHYSPMMLLSLPGQGRLRVWDPVSSSPWGPRQSGGW